MIHGGQRWSPSLFCHSLVVALLVCPPVRCAREGIAVLLVETIDVADSCARLRGSGGSTVYRIVSRFSLFVVLEYESTKALSETRGDYRFIAQNMQYFFLSRAVFSLRSWHASMSLMCVPPVRGVI